MVLPHVLKKILLVAALATVLSPVSPAPRSPLVEEVAPSRSLVEEVAQQPSRNPVTITAAATTGTATGARTTETGLYGVRWDPCRAITFRVLAHGGYRGSTADVKRAFKVLTRATRMRFVAVPAGRPTQITIRWSTPSRYPLLAGPIVGRTTTTIVGHDGVLENTRGQVVLDSTAHLLPGFTSRGTVTWGQAFLHELGHLVGLDHVDDQSQLMYPVLWAGNHRYGTGDLRLLHQVGRAGGCVPHSAR